MTVKELIEKLQKLPQDVDVAIDPIQGEEYKKILGVRFSEFNTIVLIEVD